MNEKTLSRSINGGQRAVKGGGGEGESEYVLDHISEERPTDWSWDLRARGRPRQATEYADSRNRIVNIRRPVKHLKGAKLLHYLPP